jgi:two-component system, chemotaxis family, sensor histidine kinase and response regulator WspE
VTSSDGQDYSDMSLLHLFSLEAETQTALLNDGLLTLERDPQHAESLEALMRAAHSLKGAARIVQLGAAERVAHVMEDCFVAAQEGRLVFTSEHIEVLLQGVDVLTRLAQVATTDAAAEALAAYQPEVDAQVAALRAIVTPGGAAHGNEPRHTGGDNRPPQVPPGAVHDSAAHGNEPRHTGGDNHPPQVPHAPPASSAVAMRPVEPVSALDEPIPAESSPVPVQSTPAPVQSRSELTPVLSREVVDKDRIFGRIPLDGALCQCVAAAQA